MHVCNNDVCIYICAEIGIPPEDCLQHLKDCVDRLDRLSGESGNAN